MSFIHTFSQTLLYHEASLYRYTTAQKEDKNKQRRKDVRVDTLSSSFVKLRGSGCFKRK